ncbi:MAG: tetratricopeptide repeat protein [Anaerolineae bacterium]|nr:tetratricopeptide repeat protein [Anaerolineae bacterium]
MYLKSDKELYSRRRRAPFWRILLPVLLFTVGGYIVYNFLIATRNPMVTMSTPTPLPTPTRAALSYVAEAEDAYWAGDMGGAIVAYKHALDLEPNQAELYLDLARLLIFQGYPERGLEMVREALRRQPENARAWALLGMAYDWLGLSSEAIEALEKAVTLDPTLPETYAYLAEAYIDAGDWFNANNIIATALELDATNVDVLRNRAYVLENQGNYTGAIAAYREALDVNDRLVHLYLSIGRNASALNNLGLAQEIYEDAVAIEPDNAAALDRLGWIYILLGEYDKAQVVLEKAIESEPTLPEALGHLATLYFQNHNYEDAIEMFKPALRYGEARSRRLTVFFVLTEETSSEIGNTPGGREVARAAFIHPDQFDLPLRGIVQGQGEAATIQGYVRLDVMSGRYAISLTNLPPASPGKVYVGWFFRLLSPERTLVHTSHILPLPDGSVDVLGDTGSVKGLPIENYYSLALCYYLLDECTQAQPYIEIALRIDPNDANALQTQRLCQ